MPTVDLLTSEHRHQWERFTLTHREATPFHTYDWGQLLRLACREETTLYWALWLDNEILAMWPTSIVPAFGGKVLRTLSHSGYVIPIVKEGFHEKLPELAANMTRMAKKKGVLHWSASIPKSAPYLELVSLYRSAIRPSPICNFSIDTSLDVESLWNRLHSRARKQVRRARRRGLEVRQSVESSDLSEYLAVYRSTMKQHHWPALGKEFFDLLYTCMIRKGKGRVILAHKGNKTVAGIVLLLHNGKAFSWSAASLQDSLRMSPNELLLWHAIEWACNSGFRSLDLGPAPSEESDGLNIFKRQFAPQREDWFSLTLPINHFRDSLATTLVRTYQEMRDRHLIPEIIANRLQEKIWFA